MQTNSMNTKMPKASASELLKNMKNETATELGLSNYSTADKGNLTSRQNGYVGGYMTKKMVKYAEENMK